MAEHKAVLDQCRFLDSKAAGKLILKIGSAEQHLATVEISEKDKAKVADPTETQELMELDDEQTQSRPQARIGTRIVKGDPVGKKLKVHFELPDTERPAA